MGVSQGRKTSKGTILMAIVYTDGHSRFFYVIERYSQDQQDWIRYKNTTGDEFTCLQEAFYFRFQAVEQE